MKKSCGCCPSTMGTPKAVSPCWKSKGYRRAVTGAGRGAQHQAGGERSWPSMVLRHTHKPIGGKKSVRAARGGLLQVTNKNIGVKHELPLTFHTHQHGGGGGVRLGARASAAVMLNLLKESLRLHVFHDVVVHFAGRHRHLLHVLRLVARPRQGCWLNLGPRTHRK